MCGAGLFYVPAGGGEGIPWWDMSPREAGKVSPGGVCPRSKDEEGIPDGMLSADRQRGIDKSMPEGKNPSADLTSAVSFLIT